MKHTVVTETVTARDFLKRAIQTMNDRGKRYDSPDGERSMGKAVDAFNAITGPRGMHPRYLAKEVFAWVEGQREKS
jgi:hypothetical protein